jgi:hypothetical protein
MAPANATGGAALKRFFFKFFIILLAPGKSVIFALLSRFFCAQKGVR